MVLLKFGNRGGAIGILLLGDDGTGLLLPGTGGMGMGLLLLGAGGTGLPVTGETGLPTVALGERFEKDDCSSRDMLRRFGVKLIFDN